MFLRSPVAFSIENGICNRSRDDRRSLCEFDFVVGADGAWQDSQIHVRPKAELLWSWWLHFHYSEREGIGTTLLQTHQLWISIGILSNARSIGDGSLNIYSFGVRPEN